MAKTSICVVLPMAQTSLVRVINGYFDFRAGGFPSAGRPGEDARLLGKARRPATQRTFNSRVSRYCSWCREQQVDLLTVGKVVNFVGVSVYASGAFARSFQHGHWSDSPRFSDGLSVSRARPIGQV